MLKEKILQNAVRTAWLNPHIDMQYTYKPARLSTLKGTRRLVYNEYFQVALPDSTNYYVLYQLGQIAPRRFGFQTWVGTWQRMDKLAIREKMIFNAHINFRMLAPDTVYVQLLPNGNFVVAVDAVRNKALLNSGYDLFIRFYSNVWLTTDAADPFEPIHVKSIKVTSSTDVSNLMVEYNAYKAKRGNVFLYWNGFYVDRLLVSDVKVGDELSFTYDPAGLGYYDVKLSDMDYFESELDKRRKYILLAPDNGREDKIDYLDDVEVYICSKEKDASGQPRSVGIYYSRNKFSDMRMLTRRDYSLDTNRISTMVYQQDERLLYREAYVRVFLRDSGFDKIPPKDANLVDDLYLLDKETRSAVMSGTMSVVDQWKAVNLEKSPYSLWMGLSRHAINYENLKGVISWHGLYDITQKAIFDGNDIEMPPLMERGGCVYFFNADGTLNGSRDISLSEGKNLSVQAPIGVTKAFFIPGQRAYLSADIETNSRVTRDPLSYYDEKRFYRIGNSDWMEAQEGIDFDYVTNGTEVTWKSFHTDSSRIKRNAGSFYSRTFKLTAEELTNILPIFENGTTPPSRIPMGRLAIWVEGRRLTNSIDYHTVPEDFTFRIHNWEYIQGKSEVEVHVLYYGLPDKHDSTKMGFVQHRLLNYDNVFDMAPYRNKDIYVDGKRYNSDELDFSEIRRGNMPDAVREGAVYTIQNVIGAASTKLLEGLTETRAKNLEDEQYISDFLSDYYPEEEIPGPVIINKKHHVVSTLLHRLIVDIKSNVLIISNREMSPVAVDFILKPYRHLIDVDVCQLDIDWDYINVRAHALAGVVPISSNAVSFLQQVNEMYLHNRVVLNYYVSIG